MPIHIAYAYFFKGVVNLTIPLKKLKKHLVLKLLSFCMPEPSIWEQPYAYSVTVWYVSLSTGWFYLWFSSYEMNRY
jgi:hypothetical protein